MKVFIPRTESEFTLFAEGILLDIENSNKYTTLTLSNDGITILYYTYPNHRRLYIVSVKGQGQKVTLPYVSCPVHIIYKARGKEFDLIKRACFFLEKETEQRYLRFPNTFYYELAILACSKKLRNWKVKVLMNKFGLR